MKNYLRSHFYEEVRCVSCKELFTKKTKAKGGKSLPIGVRSFISITCSPECSKIYHRKTSRLASLRAGKKYRSKRDSLKTKNE